jgi:hypothetical protein
MLLVHDAQQRNTADMSCASMQPGCSSLLSSSNLSDQPGSSTHPSGRLVNITRLRSMTPPHMHTSSSNSQSCCQGTAHSIKHQLAGHTAQHPTTGHPHQWSLSQLDSVLLRPVGSWLATASWAPPASCPSAPAMHPQASYHPRTGCCSAAGSPPGPSCLAAAQALQAGMTGTRYAYCVALLGQLA